MTDLIGRRTEEDTGIFIRHVTRERKFASGARLLLTQQDLWEICFFFNTHAIPSAVKSFVEFLETHGISENKDT